jgi:hypothetical protein
MNMKYKEIIYKIEGKVATGFYFLQRDREHIEGSRAFVEKRQPVFKGK